MWWRIPASGAGRARLAAPAASSCVARLGFVGEACDGGFAEEIVLPARLLLPVAADIDPAVAAMAEPLAVALHAVSRLSARPGQPVLVVGCGPIGGLAALVLGKRHDGPLFIADRNASRASLVAEVTGGRVVALDLRGDRRYGCAARRHRGDRQCRGARSAGRGNGAGGTIALVGIYHGSLPLDPNLLVEREIALIGCHAFADELAGGGRPARPARRRSGTPHRPADHARRGAGRLSVG